MGENAKKTEANEATVDKMYEAYTRSVIRAVSSHEFYRFFLSACAQGDNVFQFTNRYTKKAVDTIWVEKLEEAAPAFAALTGVRIGDQLEKEYAKKGVQIALKIDEIVVEVGRARRMSNDVVRQLAHHSEQVDNYDVETGRVKPNRLMQKITEETFTNYENRVAYTAMELAFQTIRNRHEALFGNMPDDVGAKLKIQSDMEIGMENVHMDMFMSIRQKDDVMATDAKNREIFDRISRLYRLYSMFMHTPFAKELQSRERVRGHIVKTNVLKKNKMYKKITDTLEFLWKYTDVGYAMAVVEQSRQVDETMQIQLFNNIFFNYLALKGYLENEDGRQIPETMKERKRTIKPKFIKQIIEELTEDYDLPDVEVRKVLIEELTKEQLMHEEAEERRRLVEEQARKKKEEEQRIRQEKAAEAERIRQEKAAERERIRREKEAQRELERVERIEREAEDRRRSGMFRKEIEEFKDSLENQMIFRQENIRKIEAEKEDFADAVQLLEEAEARKQAEAERERIRKRELREQARREKEREEERIRQEKQAELARIQAEKEEQEEIARAQEEQRRRERMEKDLAQLQPEVWEMEQFRFQLEDRKALRAQSIEQQKNQKADWEAERARRREARRNAAMQ